MSSPAVYAQELADSLSRASLVPGSAPLIPDDFNPTARLAVTYSSKDVFAGNLFRASECTTAPTIVIQSDANIESSSYTLLLVDPDAPTPDDPKFAYWRHWVLPGLVTSKDAGTVSTKPALTDYLGPGPKDDSKPHRYLFLLFREPDGFSLSKDDVGGEEFTQRRSFGAAAFVSQNNLDLVAVNWMLCAGDGWAA